MSSTKVAKNTWSKMSDADVFGRAAQLAYYFFLAVFPFLISVIAALSIFGFADKGRELMFQYLSGTLPPSAFQLISKTINDVIRASGPLKMSAGVIGSLWAASAGMRAAMDALNATHQVKETRSFIKQYGVAVGLTIAFAVLVVASVLIIVVGNTIINALSLGSTVALIWKIVQWPIALALILIAFGVVYYLAPNLAKREWHWVTPGAIAGVAMWLMVSIALRIYLHFSNNYSATYGSLGAVIILLLWFYLSGIALLSGAALNGVLERGEQRVSSEVHEVPSKPTLVPQIAKRTFRIGEVKTRVNVEQEILGEPEQIHAPPEKEPGAPVGVAIAVGIGAMLLGFAGDSRHAHQRRKF